MKNSIYFEREGEGYFDLRKNTIEAWIKKKYNLEDAHYLHGVEHPYNLMGKISSISRILISFKKERIWVENHLNDSVCVVDVRMPCNGCSGWHPIIQDLYNYLCDCMKGQNNE